MEDGLEQNMSLLIQMREQQQQQPKVEKNPVKVVTTTIIEEQVHPIGLSIVSPKTASDLITSTNSDS